MSLAQLSASHVADPTVKDVQFHIYFNKFHEATYIQVPTLTLASAITSIGGAMGVCVGASLITCIELLEFLLQLLRRAWARATGKAFSFDLDKQPAAVTGNGRRSVEASTT